MNIHVFYFQNLAGAAFIIRFTICLELKGVTWKYIGIGDYNVYDIITYMSLGCGNFAE